MRGITSTRLPEQILSIALRASHDGEESSDHYLLLPMVRCGVHSIRLGLAGPTSGTIASDIHHLERQPLNNQGMETCLCSTINRLADAFNESEARSLSLELNKHLSSIRTMLEQSKTLAHDVRYRIVPIDQRTAKILSIQHLDNTRVSRICEKVKDAIEHFWTPSDDVDHDKLRRRLACVMIYLRSKMNNHDLVPPAISSLVQGMKISELRYAGRKYIKVARRLGSIGSMIWLPLDVPAST